MAHKPERMLFSDPGRIVELSDGGLCYEMITVAFEAIAGVAVKVRLRLHDGRIAPMGLMATVTDESVGPLRLAALDLDDAIEYAVAEAAKLAWQERHGATLLADWPADTWRPLTAAEAAVQEAAIAGAVAHYRHRGPAGPSDEQLRQVAAVYTKNRYHAPVVAVSEELSVSRRTASRWVSLARERGALTDEED